MITRKGYLAVSTDGTFYSIATYQTHVGTRREWYPVKSIDEAEMFYAPHCGYHGGIKPSKEPGGGLKFVPATKRVEITLEGYGE